MLYNLFFINKAFHIDDTFTINIAQAVNKNFINVPYVFFSNPILLGYYYAPVIRLFGESEIWMHLFYLPFSLLVIASMYFLSLRFTGKGLLPTLSLVVTPAFIIMSHNIMLDIPLLGLFLTSLAVFIYGIDKNNKKLLFLSGVLAGLTVLVKYTGLILIPLMLFYCLLSDKRKYCLFLMIPIFLFSIWCVHNIIFYRSLPFIQALLMRLHPLSAGTILKRVFTCLSFISGTSIILFLLTPFILVNRKEFFLLFSSFPIGLCPFLIKSIFGEYTFIEKVFLSLLFVLSLFLIFSMLKLYLSSRSKKSYNKDRQFLFLWFFIILFFNISSQFVTARFILLLFPPMLLLFYEKIITSRIYSKNIFRKLIIPFHVIVFLFSTVLAIGDFRFAGIYRDFVEYLQKNYSDKMLYFGRLSYSDYYAWGYSYYLNRYFPYGESKNSLIHSQDIFLASPTEAVLPIVIQGKSFTNDFNLNRFLVGEVDYKSHVFLHNRKQRTGFYSYDWGLLPFKITFGKSTLEKFNIYKLPLNTNIRLPR